MSIAASPSPIGHVSHQDPGTNSGIPMATDFYPSQDPAVDQVVKRLLEQQADIQARLAALAPARFRPDIKRELPMLRHKLHVLQAYADHNSKHRRQRSSLCKMMRTTLLTRSKDISPVPSLSETEEARMLQYKCECIAAACIEHGTTACPLPL